jgi:tRNA-dihydrouridine synthase
MMEKAAELALKLGFDGVDINMGCPDKSVEKQGAGAVLIKNPELAKEIILAAKRGAKSDEGGIPVSVKTRIGYNKDELDPPAGGWLPHLLSVFPAAITIHARTRKEMSLVPARWERVKRAVEIRNELQGDDNFSTPDGFSKQQPQNCLARLTEPSTRNFLAKKYPWNSEVAAQKNLDVPTYQDNFKTLIFGNGDVLDIEDAYRKAEETGADGVMIGRGIFGNPWLFTSHKPSIEEKLRVFLEQAKLFEKIVGPKWPEGQGKSFAVMKKHLKAYCEGFPGCKELRTKMMEAENTVEMERLVNEFLMSYN